MGWSTSINDPEYTDDGTNNTIPEYTEDGENNTITLDSEDITLYAIWNQNMNKTTLPTTHGREMGTNWTNLTRTDSINFMTLNKNATQYELPTQTGTNSLCRMKIDCGGGCENIRLSGLELVYEDETHYSLAESLERGYIKSLYYNGTLLNAVIGLMNGTGSYQFSYKLLIYEFITTDKKIVGINLTSNKTTQARYLDGIYFWQCN